MAALPQLTAGTDFQGAANAVLEYLAEHLPMGFWSITRVENGQQTYLYVNDNSYGLPRGGGHPWADSYCVHMAAGTAPNVAPDSRAVPLYAQAAINDAATIGSYAGAVISEPGGELFGAICGIDPASRTDYPAFAAAGPLLQLLGQMLTMVLAADRAREVVAQQALDASIAADTDVLTGLANRRAWSRVLAEETTAFENYGDPTVLAISDLDMLKAINDTRGHAAGDDYIQRAARALTGVVRSTDMVARLGGDEFGILFRRCTKEQAGERVEQIYAALHDAGVAASVGWAPITVLRGLPAALDEADQAMYEAKRARRLTRAAAQPA